MSKWKIFYTDETSIKSDKPGMNDNPVNIAKPKRFGVHSIIQEMNDGETREVIEQYHYIYLVSEQMWMGIGLDGLLDRLVSSFEDISCVLHGRTMTSDSFFRLKKTIREDTEVVGSITAAQNDLYTPMWHRQFPFNRPVLWPEFPDDITPRVHHTNGHDKRTGQPYEEWTAYTRQRAYAPEFTDSGPYGEHREH
jgi:hypothetical protein